MSPGQPVAGHAVAFVLVVVVVDDVPEFAIPQAIETGLLFNGIQPVHSGVSR